jgi:hypothetical protein
MVRKSIIGARLCALATILVGLALPPHAAAKDSRAARFDVRSLSGTITTTRNVSYDDGRDTCAYSETERISFRSTRRTTAYASVGRYGRAVFTIWSPRPKAGVPEYLSRIKLPGEVTVAHSITYAKPEMEGCYSVRGEPTDCSVSGTSRRTLSFYGLAGLVPSHVPSSSVELEGLRYGGFPEVNYACYVDIPFRRVPPVALFSRREVFDKGRKRLLDTSRAETPVVDEPFDYNTVTGTTIHELAGELERRKTR